MLIVVLASLAPQHIVVDRIESGIKGAVAWFANGSVVEGSVSARLELWTLGLQLFQELPIFGHGTSGLALRWTEMTSEGAPFAHLAVYRTTDNELLGALAEGGVFGAVGYFGAYAGVFLAFWPWRKHEDEVVRCLSLTGLILVPVHLLFGLSVSVLGISMFRAEFVTFTCSLLAFLSLRASRPFH
jgi:O-antigen ligase